MVAYVEIIKKLLNSLKETLTKDNISGRVDSSPNAKYSDIVMTNSMQSETANFAPGAITLRTRQNIYVV